MDWNYVLSLKPTRIEDKEKETLLNTIAWFDVEVEEVDLERCVHLLKISQAIMRFKSEQVEALEAELDEVAKKQAEDELKKSELDLDSRSVKSKKSSSLDLDELEEKYREMKSKLKQQNKNNEKLKQEINKLNQQIKVLEVDRNHLQQELASLQKDETQSDISENIKDQQKELIETIRQRNKQITQLLNDIETVETENVELKEKLVDVRDKLSEATLQIQKMTDEFKGFNITINEQAETIQDLTQKNNSLKSHIDEILKDNETLKRELEEFALAIDERADNWGKIIEEKNAEIRNLKSKIPSQETSDESENQSEIEAKKQSEISTLKQIISERNKKINDLQKELEKATGEMIETTQVINRIKEEKQLIFEQSTNAKLLNDELKKKLKATRLICRGFQEEVSYFNEVIAKEDRNVEDLIKGLNESDGVKQVLEKYQKLKIENRKKEKQIYEFVKDLNRLQHHYEKMEKENLELRNRLGLSDEEIPILNVTKKEKKQQKLMRDLQIKIAKLEEEKNNLRLELRKPIDTAEYQENVLEIEESVPKEMHQDAVEENEALRRGLHEIMNSLRDRKDKGYRDINSETLQNLLKALDSKKISGWYHSGMRLQAEIHSLQGSNDELRDQLKLTRLELEKFKNDVPKICEIKEIKDEKLLEQLENYKTDLERVQKQMVELNDEYDKAKNDWNNEKIDLEKEANDVIGKVELLEFKLEEIKKLNLTESEEMKMKQISEMAGQVVILNRKNLHLENENTRILGNLNELKEESLHIEIDFKNRIKITNEENQYYVNQISILQTKLNNTVDKSKYEKLRSDFDCLTIKYRQILNEISNINEHENRQLQEAKTKADILTQENQKLVSKILELTVKINSFEVSSFEISKATETLTKKLSQSEINEFTEKQRADHMTNLYELVKEQLKKSEERLREFENYNKELMDKNLKLQEIITNHQNAVINQNAGDEFEILKKNHEKLLEENGEIKKEIEELKSKLESIEITEAVPKFWNSAREYELLSLKHQILDLQAKTDDKAVIARLSTDVVQARLMEAEAMKQLENLRKEYERNFQKFQEFKTEKIDEIKQKEIKEEKLQKQISELQQIVYEQREQYLGYVPLISEEKYVENIRDLYKNKENIYLNLKLSDEIRNENEILKEQLREQIKTIEMIDNCDLQKEISKWYNEKSIIQLQELKQRRKSEFLQNQLEQSQEKLRIQDQHMSKLEEALFFAYQKPHLDVPNKIDEIKLKPTEKLEKDVSIKILKSEETQTIIQNNSNRKDEETDETQIELFEKYEKDIKSKDETIDKLKSKITEMELNLSLFKTQLGDKQSQILFYEKHILETQNKKDPNEDAQELAKLKSAMVKIQTVLLEREEQILEYQSLLKQDRDEHSLAAQRMQEEVKHLQAVIIENQKAYQELKEETKIDENPKGKLAVEQYIKQVHILENHTEELHTNLSTIQNQLTASREECVRWRSLANDRLEGMENLRKNLEEMHQNEVRIYQMECEKWSREVLELKAFVSKYQGNATDQSAELQKLIKDKDNRIHELTIHLRQLKSAPKKKPETAESSPRIQDLENEKEHLSKELETLRKKCENLLTKEKNYREEIRNLNNQLMKKPITSVRTDKSDQLNKKLSILEKENLELKDTLRHQLVLNETRRTKAAEDFDKWNKQKAFQQSAEKLRVKLKEKADELEKSKRTCAGYRILIEKLEREKHALETKNKNLRGANAGAVRAEILEIENAKLREELDALRIKCEMSSLTGTAVLQEKLEAQERKIAVLELSGKGSCELRNEIERLQTALANLHKANLRLEAENLEFQLDLEKFTKEVPHLREQVAYLENYIDVLKTENSNTNKPPEENSSQQNEPKKVPELERTVFVLKRVVEKLQVENKRLQSSKLCNEKCSSSSDEALRRSFYKLKEQYGDCVQKIARLKEENLQLRRFKEARSGDKEEVEKLRSDLEQKMELLEKVKVLLHRAANKEKALLEEISRLKSLGQGSSSSVASN